MIDAHGAHETVPERGATVADVLNQAAQGAGGASGWATQTDPRTGRTYFYNKVTRETSWTPPAGTSVRRAAISQMGRGDAAAATWIVRGDHAGSAATPRPRRG